MTLRTSARLAGMMFLLYIATGIADVVLSGQATAGADTAAKLATIARQATTMRLVIVLRLLTFVDAVVLAAALYALTREVDRDLAVLALSFRVSEGVIGAVSAVRTVGLLSVATAAGPPDVVAASVLLKLGGFALLAATSFAVGSAIYSYLFLRGRSIPVALAWLGVLASVLLVVVLPLQLAGFARGLVTQVVWLPMFVFELALALWLIVKGVAPVDPGSGRAGSPGGDPHGRRR